MTARREAGQYFSGPAVEIARARTSSYRRRIPRAAKTERRKTMEYLLLIYGDEKAMSAVTEANAGKMLAAYGAYAEAMGKAGVIRGGNRLRPTSAATTVRIANGKTTVLDGPYAETKEQLGGYFLIDVPDLDAALSWAERCPGASTGVIEVRPVWAM
jgi:hypothetical protein